MSADLETTSGGEELEGAQTGPSVPHWARPGGRGPSERIGWRSLLRRRRLIWAVAGVVVLIAVWSNYPFVPNLLILLFRQPSGDVASVSGPDLWAMRGGNPQGTNFVPFGPPPEGIVERVIDIDSGIRSSAAVQNGVAYIGGESRILAIDTTTGQQVWEHAASGPAHGAPALAGGSLFIGTLNKRVIALDAASGRELWEYEGDSPFPGTVTVQDGILFAGSRGGDVRAIDADSGELLWKVGLDTPAVSPVAVWDGRIFAASSGGVLFIRNSGTGDKLARIRTNSALVTPPTVVDGQVYLVSGGSLMAFDARVRELPGRYAAELIWAQLWVWGFPLPSPSEHSGLQWRVHLGGEAGSFVHTPAVTSDSVYAGTDEGKVVAMDPADGSILWQKSVGAPAASSVVVVENTLIVAQNDGAIRALDRFSQEELWMVSLGSPVAGPLSFAGGKIYAHTQDGRLHVIR